MFFFNVFDVLSNMLYCVWNRILSMFGSVFIFHVLKIPATKNCDQAHWCSIFFVILNNLWFFHCWWGLTTLFNRNTLVRNLLYYVLADPLLSEPWNHQSVKVGGKIFQYFWRENQPVWRSLPPVRRLPASERPHPSYETNSEPEKWIIFVRLVVVSWRWSIATCLI